MSEQKFVRRFPPAPAYEVRKIEAWLEDLALEGLVLVEQGFALGHFLFRQDVPKKIHYRLEVVEKSQSFWSGDPKMPFPESQALHEELGWQFLFRWYDFFIYRSLEENPVELYTDRQIQDHTLKLFKRKLWGSLLANTVLNLFLMRTLFLYPVSSFLVMGPALFLLPLVFWLEILARPVEALVSISRLKKCIHENSPPDANYRKNAWFYKARPVVSLVFTLLLFVSLIGLRIGNGIQTPSDEVVRQLPFVTLLDLAEESPEHTLDRINNYELSPMGNILFPEAYEYLDGGTVKYADGHGTSGLLEVQYMEAANPWLARKTAEEFTQFYSSNNLFSKNEMQLTELAGLALDVDYAVGLSYEHIGLIRVILNHGNVTVVGRFSMGDENGSFNMETWTKEMAEVLKSQ